VKVARDASLPEVQLLQQSTANCCFANSSSPFFHTFLSDNWVSAIVVYEASPFFWDFLVLEEKPDVHQDKASVDATGLRLWVLLSSKLCELLGRTDSSSRTSRYSWSLSRGEVSGSGGGGMIHGGCGIGNANSVSGNNR
jgi:hypothetical protein